MNAKQYCGFTIAAFGLAIVYTPTFADQLGARYDQDVFNGDGVVNGAALNGVWLSSFAATYQDELSVADRPRPEYDAKGLPLGAFRLFPTLDLGGGYTDNVFFTPSATNQDWFYSISPEVRLKSQWAEDSVVIYGGLQSVEYDKFSSQDVTNWNVGGSTRLVVTRDTDLRANTYYDAMHEPLSSPESPGSAAKPTEYRLYHADLAVDHKPNRFGMSLGASTDDYSYDPTSLVGGGKLNNRDRDENIYTVYGRASYDFSIGYRGFVGASYDDRNFILPVDRNGFDRDSSGYQVNAGVDMLLTRLVRGQLYVGYQTEDYKAPLRDVNTLNYGVDINWYATQLMTVHVSATRAIDDTSLVGASASSDQTVIAGIDYEVLRDVIVGADFYYTDSDFIGTKRRDTIPGVGLTGKWLINRYLSLDATYSYGDRNSNAVGQDYSNNVFALHLTVHP